MNKFLNPIGDFFVNYGLRIMLALTILGAGFSIGFGVAQHQADQAQVKTVTKTVEVVKTQVVQQAIRDLAAEKKLQAQVAELTDERDFLQRVLNEKPDPDPGVYVRLGDVRLLNDAADPAANRTDPARVAAYQEQAYSTLALRPFVSAEVDLRSQYNTLAARCDALVDWVDRELVQPQTKK